MANPAPLHAETGPDSLGQAAEGEAQSELLLPIPPSPGSYLLGGGKV